MHSSPSYIHKGRSTFLLPAAIAHAHRAQRHCLLCTRCVGMASSHPTKIVAREARVAQDQTVIAALQQLFPEDFSSDTGAKKQCRRKEVLIEGLPASTTSVVKAGELLQILARNGAPALPTPVGGQQGPGLQILFEDDHLAVVIKPPGLPTQGKGLDTLQRRIKYCLTASKAVGASKAPFNIHRLDAPTTGLVVCAKTRVAGAKLSGLFADRAVDKRYLAIVKGRVEGTEDETHGNKLQKISTNEGQQTAAFRGQEGVGTGTQEDEGDSTLQDVIDSNIQGKKAITHWRVLQVTPSHAHGHLTTLSLHPHTGRKHQLRRHCADVLGCPILGDARYQFRHGAAGPKRGRQELQQVEEAGQKGDENDREDEGEEEEESQTFTDGTHLCLAAAELRFTHPITGEQLHLSMPEPEYFEAVRKAEART